MEHVMHRLFMNLFMNEYLLLIPLLSPQFIPLLISQRSSRFTSLLYFLTLSAAFSRSALDLL